MKRWRPLTWMLLSLACFIAAYYFWRLGDKWQAQKPSGTAKPATPAPSAAATPAPTRLTSSFEKRQSTAPVIPPLHPMTNNIVRHSTNFPYRLSNTAQDIGRLMRSSKAVLLENALIDSSKPLDLQIPDSLRAQGDPGAYIVQADGVINNAFRAQLKAAGLTVVSYIPNNAYLVTGSAAQVASFGTAAMPWQPYYKIKSALMPAALARVPVSAVNVAVFPGAVPETTAALKKLGVTVVSQSPSPFGTELALQNVADIAAVANLKGIEEIEPSSWRVLENDLTRVLVSETPDVYTSSNYLDLSGSNVLVEVNDSWVPTNASTDFNPDLLNIIGPTNLFPIGIADLAGHATHVGGIIASSGDHSPTNAIGSPPYSNCRGKAPLATLFAMPLNDVSDAQLQQAAAQTNALISNNSWGYGDTTYDLAAASYDQAVRDSVPWATGPQPVTYVFAAGNSGNGDPGGDGFGGQPDSISSPGIAKNVITVGASMLPRDITNDTYECDLCETNNGCDTNQPWLADTSSSNLVTDFSSRGNVEIGVEGQYGRFKPDVVAPGAMVVSTRSMTWDTNAYYDPTNNDVTEFDGDTVGSNALFNYSFFVPCDTAQMTVSVTSISPTNVPLVIYVDNTTFPTTSTFTAMGTNSVSLPPAAPLTPTDTQWFVSVENPTNVPVTYDIVFTLTTTNDLGNYFNVLEGLNAGLLDTNGQGPYYRYESGTSMATPAVSGLLALMEDFFTNRLKYTPSPALMKALLINGARSINAQYDFQVQNSINYQGWGLVNITNSLPTGITNSFGQATPMFYVDQSTNNVLQTGDSQTYFLNVNSNAEQAPLRITLAWTDPPGNPLASLKLVNNLELIVTNFDNPTNPAVFFGNDFDSGNIFTSQWDGDSNNIPYDTINNIQNVYLPLPLGTNYSITIFAKDVNVNAVTLNTNNIVQDYALVVSSDNGEISNAFTVLSAPPVNSSYMPDVTQMTNEFAQSPTVSGGILLNQLVGASSLFDTNFIPLSNQDSWGTNGQITLGTTNQWHFYVITNTVGSNATVASFTNALFATFLPPELSVPPVGVNAANLNDATPQQADIDLFVARGPNAYNLTNLDPTVVAAADKALGLGGTKFIVYSNAQPGEVFYIGVQSEDQEAAIYAFAGLFSLNPFSTLQNGVEVVQGINVPNPIPSASSSQLSSAITLGVAVQPIQIQRVVVTNVIEAQNFGDLFGTLSHNNVSDVLNNHSFGNGSTNQELIYEDNGEGNIFGSIPSDGPGSLRSFIGQQGVGLWTLTEYNNAEFNTGAVESVSIRLEPQGTNNSVVATIQPHTFFYDFIDVPANATNLTICVEADPAAGTFTAPLDLYVRYGALPTQETYDYTEVINPPGDCLSIGLTSLPPLKPGRYYFGVYNPDSTAQTVEISWTLGLNVAGVTPDIVTSTTVPISLPVDAVTNNSIFITNQQTIVSVNVGVVLTAPNVADLDLTLVSPTGQRILLFENRGGISATNMGHLSIVTNYFGQTTPGGASANTNVIGPVPTNGTLYVDYNMFTVPDRMDVYYEGVDIFSTVSSTNLSGLISGAGTFAIPYPHAGFPLPATNNTITIVMNQGNNPVETTQWIYTPYVVTENYTYLTFTDNTNLTDIPIKFAIPPFDAAENGTNIFFGDFDVATNGDYIATPASPTNFIPDISGGWSLTTNNVFVFPTNYYTGTNLLNMSTNFVTVFTDPNTAVNGTNVLALGQGSISRVLSLVPQRSYTISYLYRGPGINGWWRGEGNASDSSDPEAQANNGQLIGRFNFPAGEVGQAFAMEDSGLAFQFAGTNTYVQIRQSPSLDVGSTNDSGFTVEGWINPTNTTFQQPLVEWLAHVPTNTVVNGQPVTNLVIEAGPFLNRENGHYYYLLGQTNWTTSELWANALGGHLAEVDNANQENFIYDTFAQFGLTNHTMWIGLTNGGGADSNFVWSTGNSNVAYMDWALDEPTNCGDPGFVAILGPTNALPGLWTVLNNQGVDCNGVTNAPFGVAEVDEIQTNGVQLWISVTNSLTNNVLTGNGRLYANIMDTNNVPHEIFSAPGLIQSNVFQHVALTYNTNTGVAELFYDGTNVATTNLGVFVPNTGGDMLLGKDMSRITNNFFWGLMDEMSIYSRFLSDAEIYSIYNVSASTTNRTIGKFNPAITPAESLAEAQAVFGNVTNLLFGVNNTWQAAGFTIQPTSNTLPVQITGLEPGVLLDSLTLSAPPTGDLFYLPEQDLDDLVGSNAFGNWTLEIRDSRTGATTNDTLVSWELQFVLQTNTPAPTILSPQTLSTNIIPSDSIAYYVVNVPDWANDATNLLVSSTSPVSLLFNQTNPPETGNPGDFTLLANSMGGIGNPVLQANPPSIPPLLPGQSYYLAVTNSNAVPATVVVQVNYNITTLSNGVPFSARFRATDLERPFVFNVTTNGTEATFQLLQLTGDADLVLRQGLPLPSLLSADYGSFNGTNANETIYVTTNSAPVPLSAGSWYLDVVKRGSGPMRYAILAKELDPQPSPPVPAIINLSNGVPVTWTAGPGAALTNFFHFGTNNFTGLAPTNISGIHFELYNQTGNGNLTVQTDALPLLPPFFQSSQLPANDAQFIFIHTNALSLTNLVLDWYLGVPNNETNPITYTIVGVIDTNLFASFPTAEGAGSSTRGGAFQTNVYHVTTLNDSGPGSLRAAVTSTNGGGTVVFDTSGAITLAAPLYITNSFLTIAGQTAPGGQGVTITGAPTYVQDATDIILRYLRFRPVGTNIGDSLQFTNVANIVADHVSAAFGANNVMSVLNSSNITVQWSVIADSLNTTNASTGGSSVRFGSGDVTLHHNLYVDNYSANPTIGEDVTVDFVNNVIYNWGIFAGDSTNDLTDDPDITNFLNYSANYIIAGANSVFTNGAFWSSSSNTWIFQTNNFIDTNLNHILDGSDTSWAMFNGQFTEFSAPWPILPTAPDEAFIAYERVLDFAGASMAQRDPMDIGTVEQVRTLGGTNAAEPGFLSGMVAWWKADSNYVDSVGGHDGTPQGGVSFVPGEVNEAFGFDPTSYTAVDVPDAPAFVLTNAFTIEGWIRPTGDGYVIFWRGDNRPGFDPYTLSMQGNNTLSFGISDNANNGASVSTTLTYSNWTHVAATFDQGVMDLYTNGVLAAQTITNLVPIGNLIPGDDPGVGIGNVNDGQNDFPFVGDIDELSVYDRALSPCEIAAIYNAGHGGKESLLAATNATSSSTPQYLDTSGDGIPDFWKITLGENVTNFDANLDRTGDGYTELEEYLDWLGGPHALTVTNTTTDVDLYVLAGKTGNLAFGVQNGTNGTVYLTNSPTCEDPAGGGETIAVFTPTNNFGGGTNGGFASFGFMVTNLDTVAYFGPVTVSVFVSSVPITNAFVFSFPNPTNVIMAPGTTLMVTNTATPTNGVTYTPINPPPWEGIDTNTGVITLSPPANEPPTNVVITTVATDTNVPPDMLTNTFTVTVVAPGTVPYAFTQPAQAVTDTSAQLNGMATPNGVPTIAWFEWGTNTLYGNQTAPVNVGSGLNVVYLNSQITNLAPNVPYHFRLDVSNTLAVVHGFDQILDEAYVAGWGANYLGQIDVPLGINNFVSVAAAYDHSLALKTNGIAVAWGDNTFNQTNVPAGLSNLLAVAGGEYYSIALRNNGTVATWGGNLLGQTNEPPGLSNVIMISGGTYASFALQTNGNVVAWGGDFFGVTNTTPLGLANIVEVAGGTYHSLALKNDGTIIAWGDNSAGQTNVPASATNVVAIAAGNLHSLALCSNGTVVAWGDDSAGQTNVPPGLSNVVAVAAGGFHSLALKNDGTIVAWGDDSAGQTSVPVGLTNVVAISAGYFHSLALTPIPFFISTNVYIFGITNGEPETNSISPGQTVFYRVNVPNNADFATNTLIPISGENLNVWFTTNHPPTITNANDVLLLADTNSGSAVLSQTTTPKLIDGTTYYLGVQNTNMNSVTYGVEVNFHFVTTSPSTNTTTLSIIQTNIDGTTGFLLTWYAPSNDLFQVQWSSNLPPVWNTFTNIIGCDTNVTVNPTNTLFEFFDNGSETGGLSPIRFYQLILLNPSSSPSSPNVIPLTNGVPLAYMTSAGATNFFSFNITQTNPAVLFELYNLSGNSLLTLNESNLPVTPPYFTSSATASTNYQQIVLRSTNTPGLSNLNAISWFLGVPNANSNPITYTIRAVLPTNGILVSGLPIATTVSQSGGTNVQLTWAPTVNGEIYEIRTNANLASANWGPLTDIVASGTSLTFTNPVPAGNLPALFYWVVQVP